MSDLTELDLQSSIVDTTCDVFETMLSMGVTIETLDGSDGIDGQRVVGSVGFAGSVTGNVRIHLSEQFARMITAAMLGMEMEEIEADEVADVVGEVSNMIGGDLKSKFCDCGFPCELSIPTTTQGSHFSIQTLGGTRLERFGFRHDDHLAIVEVTMRTGD